MRIGICGTHCNGKSTLVKAFKQKYPMYKSPEKTYRDIVQEKNINLNRNGDVESQAAILDALCEQSHKYANEKYFISDRIVTDNFVYTMYLADKNKIPDDFIIESIQRHRDAIKNYDIVFWLPLNGRITLDDLTNDNPNRDTDEIYRQEIDEIFKSIHHSYVTNANLLFQTDDQPLFMKLEGDLSDKMNIIAEYIGNDGNLVETEKSVLTTMEEEFDRQQLLQQIGIFDKK